MLNKIADQTCSSNKSITKYSFKILWHSIFLCTNEKKVKMWFSIFFGIKFLLQTHLNSVFSEDTKGQNTTSSITVGTTTKDIIRENSKDTKVQNCKYTKRTMYLRNTKHVTRTIHSTFYVSTIQRYCVTF